jgi:hypothetical protein
MHPLTRECGRHCKVTGKPCRRLVKGSGPCHVHGGAAKQIRARQEKELLLFEARQERQARQSVEPERELSAAEILIGLLRDVKATLEHVKLMLAESPSLLGLKVAGEWADLLERVARSVIVLKVEDLAIAVTREQVATLTRVLDRVLCD